METRSEKKWKIDRQYLFQLINGLKSSYFCFRNHYEPRWINSIYFDDNFYTSIRQNLDGNYLKQKNRARWYGEMLDPKEIKFEIKKKFGNTSVKNRYTLFDEETKLGKNFVKIIENKVKKKFPSKINLKPISMTRYFRYYFISKYKNIRATIDTNISYYKIFENRIQFEKYIDKNNILEMKYESKYDGLVRKNLNINNLRLSRNSKYINSFFFRSL